MEDRSTGLLSGLLPEAGHTFITFQRDADLHAARLLAAMILRAAAIETDRIRLQISDMSAVPVYGDLAGREERKERADIVLVDTLQERFAESNESDNAPAVPVQLSYSEKMVRWRLNDIRGGISRIFIAGPFAYRIGMMKLYSPDLEIFIMEDSDGYIHAYTRKRVQRTLLDTVSREIILFHDYGCDSLIIPSAEEAQEVSIPDAFSDMREVLLDMDIFSPGIRIPEEPVL